LTFQGTERKQKHWLGATVSASIAQLPVQLLLPKVAIT